MITTPRDNRTLQRTARAKRPSPIPPFDPLFGSTLVDARFYRAFNASGQIAFRYQLLTGESAEAWFLVSCLIGV